MWLLWSTINVTTQGEVVPQRVRSGARSPWRPSSQQSWNRHSWTTSCLVEWGGGRGVRRDVPEWMRRLKLLYCWGGNVDFSNVEVKWMWTFPSSAVVKWMWTFPSSAVVKGKGVYIYIVRKKSAKEKRPTILTNQETWWRVYSPTVDRKGRMWWVNLSFLICHLKGHVWGCTYNFANMKILSIIHNKSPNSCVTPYSLQAARFKTQDIPLSKTLLQFWRSGGAAEGKWWHWSMTNGVT